MDTGHIIAWTVAALGFPVGASVAYLAVDKVTDQFKALKAGLIAGFFIGLAQYLALIDSVLWIAATSIGLGVASLICFRYFERKNDDKSLIYRGIITGLCVGVLQILAASSRKVTVFWVLVLCVAFAVGWITSKSLSAKMERGWVIFGISGAIMFQIITLFFWNATLGDR